MKLGLDGRVAIVTGAGAGIGLATTRALLAEGARVVAADLDTAALAAAPHDALLPVVADLREPAAGERLARAALERFGAIDILFNNAATAPTRTGFLAIEDDHWQATLQLNLMGYVRTSRAVLPHMVERGRGVLVHCASETGRIPHPLLPDYSVSKAGILMLSKILATEFGPQGVRSNVVSPAHVRTALWDKPGGFLDSLAARFDSGREEAIDLFLKQANIPAGRLGRPEDVAAAVLYLVSDQADFVTGVELAVNGGVTKFV